MLRSYCTSKYFYVLLIAVLRDTPYTPFYKHLPEFPSGLIKHFYSTLLLTTNITTVHTHPLEALGPSPSADGLQESFPALLSIGCRHWHCTGRRRHSHRGRRRSRYGSRSSRMCSRRVRVLQGDVVWVHALEAIQLLGCQRPCLCGHDICWVRGMTLWRPATLKTKYSTIHPLRYPSF